MIVNPSKTEVVIFGKTDLSNTEINFAGTMVNTSTNMKALGITLNYNLKWDTQVNTAISRSQARLSLLRKIRPYITIRQFLTIATSQIFSTAYYASAVWLNQTLSYKLWKRMESFHYRVMRVGCNDFRARKKRKVIDSLCQRATPVMWSKYISASMAIKITRDMEPKLLYEDVLKNMTTVRRKPDNGRFFDTSRRKIGKHAFANRLIHLNNLDFSWLNKPMSNDSIRTSLKQHLNFDFQPSLKKS